MKYLVFHFSFLRLRLLPGITEMRSRFQNTNIGSHVPDEDKKGRRPIDNQAAALDLRVLMVARLRLMQTTSLLSLKKENKIAGVRREGTNARTWENSRGAE